MKKFFYNFFFPLLLIFFCFVFKSSVFAQWTKYAGNPVLEGTGGMWDSRDTQNSSIIIDDDSYKLWYGGNDGSGWRIGYATSSAGLNNWQKHNTPVIAIDYSSGWEIDSTEPNVIKENANSYKMWYTSISNRWYSGSDRFRIKFSSSSDGINWENYAWVLNGTTSDWDSGGPARGLSVLKDGSGYKMWYAGVDDTPIDSLDCIWQIGYATSPDGINWTKHPNNPVIRPDTPWELNSVSYPNVIYDNGKYRIWYAAASGGPLNQIVYAESTDGINWNKPADKNPVLTKGPPGTFDSAVISSPFVLKVGNTLKMWYDGFDGNYWRIGYAENTEENPVYPVILIPGHGASFNYAALVHNETVSQSDWKMTPFIRSYKGIINTFKNDLSYPDNKFYVFNYDWRKPVDSVADDLKNFIDNKVKPENSDLSEFKANFIGHSLGGLVARSFGQKYENDQINKIISVGSPQKGTLQAYNAWEAGEIANRNGWQWLALELLLQLNKPNFLTKTSTLRLIAPGTKDLLPVFNYLKSNQFPFMEIPVNSLTHQNDWLINLGTPDNQFMASFSAVYGNAGQTPEFYRVKEKNLIDKILGNWDDGQPVFTEYGNGDSTILTKSAYFNSDPAQELNLNHGELVEKQAGIAKILDELGINYSTISEAPAIIYNPSLLFVLASPANFQIIKPDNTIISSDENKLVFLENALNGDYEIEIIGEDSGHYRLLIGQLTTTGDYWSELNGNTTAGQKDVYKINFDKNSPLNNPLFDQTGEDYLKQALDNLKQINNECKNSSLTKAINKSSLTINLIKNKNYKKAFVSFQETLLSVFYARKNLIKPLCRNLSVEAINNLSLAYSPVAKKAGFNLKKKDLQKLLKITESLFNIKAQLLDKAIKKNKATQNQTISFKLAEENLNKAKEAFNKGNYSYTQILLEIINLFLGESI